MTGNPDRYKLLFLCSSGGLGGPSALLYSTLKHLDRRTFEPVAAFYRYNDGPDTRLIRALGIRVLFLDRAAEEDGAVPGAVQPAGTRCRGGPHGGSPGPPRRTRIPRVLGDLKHRLRTFLGEDTYEDVSVVVKDSPRGLGRLRRLVGLLRKEHIDLIMLNNDVPFHPVGILAAKLAGVPCVCRKGWFGGGGPIERTLARHVDCYIASSHAMSRHHRDMRLAAKRMITIHEGVDLRAFADLPDHRPIRQELQIRPEAPVIGSIARVAEGKGQPDLVSAAALVLTRCPQARFLIVGDDLSGGGRLDDLKRQAAELHISDSVIFPGWRNDTREMLSAIDVFVAPNSTYLEALSITVLEAMAAGKPTVVTTTGALPETTVNGETGFVVPPSQPSRLAEALVRLTEDRQLRETMGDDARQRARRLFDIRTTVRRSERVFLELLPGRTSLRRGSYRH